MNYLTVGETSKKWNISPRRIQHLCVQNRIPSAKREGTTWIIPEDAKKPEDLRKKELTQDTLPNSIREARKSIKQLAKKSYHQYIDQNYPPNSARKIVLATFFSEIISCLCDQEEQEKVRTFVGSQFSLSTKEMKALQEDCSPLYRAFLSTHEDYVDDAPSWFYQTLNKFYCDNDLSSTQFFTEKYMIHHLMGYLDLTKEGGKVFDPACGGGNFLLYSLEMMVKSQNTPLQLPQLQDYLNRLYGYELDKTLAVVAGLNLKIKALSLLSNEQEMTLDLPHIEQLQVSIFTSMEPEGHGFLSSGDTEVINIDHKSVCTLDDLSVDVQFYVTNPPFLSVKGLDQEKKEYLKTNYPTCNCDVCVAFLEKISKVAELNAKIAIVSQNSWLHLKSFSKFRTHFFSSFQVNTIVELGTNAFYDISGEKANVALLYIELSPPHEQSECNLISLRHETVVQIESRLETRERLDDCKKRVRQTELIEHTIDMISNEKLVELLKQAPSYSQFARPMQGSSTGDAKELIDFYWHRQQDKDWVLVSKGGGYSRWQGLNSYVVKWGNAGEFIQAQKGSALRNVSYFKETDIVFSDTGTGGLNARILLHDQIFIASGPGIRILKGTPLAHLGFLNSRLASYYIRVLSPKMVISPGYVGKLPVLEELLHSQEIEHWVSICLEKKQERLRKHPCHIEFDLTSYQTLELSVDELVQYWYNEDIEAEWEQLKAEFEIECVIETSFALEVEEKEIINQYIGEKKVYNPDSSPSYSPACSLACSHDNPEITTLFSSIVNEVGILKRTKSKKSHLGSDGCIEFIAKTMGLSCEEVYATLKVHPCEKVTEFYKNMLFHGIIVTCLGQEPTYPLEEVMANVKVRWGFSQSDMAGFSTWVETSFHHCHTIAYLQKAPWQFHCGAFHKEEQRL